MNDPSILQSVMVADDYAAAGDADGANAAAGAGGAGNAPKRHMLTHASPGVVSAQTQHQASLASQVLIYAAI